MKKLLFLTLVLAAPLAHSMLSRHTFKKLSSEYRYLSSFWETFMAVNMANALNDSFQPKQLNTLENLAQKRLEFKKYKRTHLEKNSTESYEALQLAREELQIAQEMYKIEREEKRKRS